MTKAPAQTDARERDFQVARVAIRIEKRRLAYRGAKLKYYIQYSILAHRCQGERGRPESADLLAAVLAVGFPGGCEGAQAAARFGESRYVS